MKILSRNLLLYAFLLFVYTLLFRFGLGALLTAEKWFWVIIIAVVYGGMIFFTAWTTGKRDGMENFLFDAGFRWNLTTFVVWGIASEAWFLLGLHSLHETIRVVHITLFDLEWLPSASSGALPDSAPKNHQGGTQNRHF